MSSTKSGRAYTLAGLVFMAGLIVYCAFLSHQYALLAQERAQIDSRDFHDQFNQGKACGLLTNKEAAALLGTPVGTSSTIISANGVTARTRSGMPRIDSCTHTAIKSSDGYIDLILKDYGSPQNAAKTYPSELAQVFTSEPMSPAGLGQKLTYGDGVFYLLKDQLIIEIGASKTPRVGDAATKAFALGIVQSIAGKL